jgi:tetratricopeptide (TPR) repeat protein
MTLGSLYFDKERWQEAEATFQCALSSFVKESGDLLLQGKLYQNIGVTLFRQKDLLSARMWLDKGISLFAQIDEPILLGNAFVVKAEISKEQQDIESAIDYYKRAIAALMPYKDTSETTKKHVTEFSNSLTELENSLHRE